jgi:hypothetical protein
MSKRKKGEDKNELRSMITLMMSRFITPSAVSVVLHGSQMMCFKTEHAKFCGTVLWKDIACLHDCCGEGEGVAQRRHIFMPEQ